MGPAPGRPSSVAGIWKCASAGGGEVGCATTARANRPEASKNERRRLNFMVGGHKGWGVSSTESSVHQPCPRCQKCKTRSFFKKTKVDTPVRFWLNVQPFVGK